MISRDRREFPGPGSGPPLLPPAELARRATAALRRVSRPSGFPWTAPTWPSTLPLPEPERRTGADYDTEWSRRYGVRVARAFLLEGVARPVVHAVIPPTVEGLDRIDALEGPAIFAANHSSHLDTPLLLTSMPRRFRHRTVVVGGADYFFDTRWKGALWSFTLAAIPIDRTRVSRRAVDLPASLLQDGWNVVIYPEGGRSPDGWAQRFTGGAAYLATRTGVPIVPVHISGTSAALPKGGRRLRPGRTGVSFGRPLAPAEGEEARRLAARLEAEVAALADERTTDWWRARQRAGAGQTPALTGPDVADWRRQWARPDERRRRTERPWPL
ncbi:MAG TPA: lysophospholipid acyltransferase family protein [Acidimicrobiales bacterium]|nr:lysophospholipid acyltransferase family protein [Acidimicrobiales bacterium]